MKKPILNSFLRCTTLEFGGKIIGWCGVIIGTIGLQITLLTATVAIWGLNDLTKNQENVHTLRLGYIATITVYSILSLYLALFITASSFFILGQKKRSTRKMIFMLIMLAIGVVIGFLDLITGISIASIIINVFLSVVAIYLFVAVLSIYQEIEIEKAEEEEEPDIEVWATTSSKVF